MTDDRPSCSPPPAFSFSTNLFSYLFIHSFPFFFSAPFRSVAVSRALICCAAAALPRQCSSRVGLAMRTGWRRTSIWPSSGRWCQVCALSRMHKYNTNINIHIYTYIDICLDLHASSLGFLDASHTYVDARVPALLRQHRNGNNTTATLQTRSSPPAAPRSLQLCWRPTIRRPCRPRLKVGGRKGLS